MQKSNPKIVLGITLTLIDDLLSTKSPNDHTSLDLFNTLSSTLLSLLRIDANKAWRSMKTDQKLRDRVLLSKLALHPSATTTQQE